MVLKLVKADNKTLPPSTWGNGSTIENMDMANSNLNLGINMWAILSMELRKVMGARLFPMGTHTRESITIINSMDKAPMCGKMGPSIQGSFVMACGRDMASGGQRRRNLVIGMRVGMLMIGRMGLESMCGRMGLAMREGSRRI